MIEYLCRIVLFLLSSILVTVALAATPQPPVYAAMDAELRTALERSFAVVTRNTPDRAPPFSVVIKGGISLGVYESGVNWSTVQILKHLTLDEHSSVRPQLLAAAGASAGAINGFLTALHWCTAGYKESYPGDPGSADDGSLRLPDTLSNNIVRNAWHAIDIDQLLNPKVDPMQILSSIKQRDQKLEDNAAFSRAVLRDIQKEVENEIGWRHYRDACDVAFGLSLTRSIPVSANVGGIDIAQQRLVAPFRLYTTADAGLKVYDFPFGVPEDDISDPQESDPKYHEKMLENLKKRAERGLLHSVIYLDSTDDDLLSFATRSLVSKQENYSISIKDVFQAIKASSAFPGAFAPIKLNYCIYQPEVASYYASTNTLSTVDQRCPEKFQRKTSFFVDGGVFDNDPVELIRELSERQVELSGNDATSNEQVMYLKVDPGRRRAPDDFYKFTVPVFALGGDSLDIKLWAGSPPGQKIDRIDNKRVRRIGIVQCRKNGDAWLPVPGVPDDFVLLETANKSQTYLGTLHTSSPEPSDKLRYASDSKLQPEINDRILFYANDEAIESRPTCSDDWQKVQHRATSIIDVEPAGLSTQLNFAGGSVGSARGYRLYDELMRYEWKDGLYHKNVQGAGRLFHPARLTPITGDYLNAFGAFFGERFRDFDYYAGVYDGMLGLAEFICEVEARAGLRAKDEGQVCRGEYAERIYLQLCVPNIDATDDREAACREREPLANTAIHKIAMLEVCGIDVAKKLTPDDCFDLEKANGWKWVTRLVPWYTGVRDRTIRPCDVPSDFCELAVVGSAVFTAEATVAATGGDGFPYFIRALKKDVDAGRLSLQSDAVLARVINKADRPISTWFYPVAETAIAKLLTIEDEDKDKRESFQLKSSNLSKGVSGLLASAGFVSESIWKDPVGWQWNQTSVPQGSEKRWLATLAPSEYAVDTRNGGSALYWNPGFRFPVKSSSILRLALDFRIGPYLRQHFDNRTIEFSEATLFITQRTDKLLISSFGVGPSYNLTWNNSDFEQDDNVGYAITVGFIADKVRLTWGVRSATTHEFQGEDVYWHLGLNDLPGMAYWVWQGF